MPAKARRVNVLWRLAAIN